MRRETLDTKDRKALEPRGAGENLVERDEFERFWLLPRNDERGRKLQGIGGCKRVDADQPLGALAHCLDLGDWVTASDAIECVATRAAQQIVKPLRRALQPR